MIARKIMARNKVYLKYKYEHNFIKENIMNSI